MEEQRPRDVNLEELIGEAEEKFRNGVEMLNELGAEARELIQKRPGVVLAGIAVLGFLTGVLLRRNTER